MPMASDTASQLQPLWWWMVDGHCSGLCLDWHRSSDPQLGEDMVEAEGEKLIRDRHDAVPGPGPVLVPQTHTQNQHVSEMGLMGFSAFHKS